MPDLIFLKMDQTLMDEVLNIAKYKFPLRNINSYAEATREALIEFIKKNRRYLPKENDQNQTIVEGSS